jgi:hypothetical protein
MSQAAKPTGETARCKQIGDAVVEGFRAMAAGGADPTESLWKEHWSEHAVSVEGTGEAFAGIEEIRAKCAAWEAGHDIVRCEVEGPFVGPSGFSVIYDMEVVEKASGTTIPMREVGVYRVEGGKVVREEFMYGPGPA